MQFDMVLTENKNASQEIVEYLLNQIQNKVFQKGDKLPTEHEFCEMLGVSRIPLREAICSLKTIGLLESRKGGGTYVTSKCDPAILGHMLYDYAILENVDPQQVLDVRMLLEPEAARKAALNASQREKEELWQLVQEYAELVKNFDKDPETNTEAIAQLDIQIHQSIALASHNEFLWMLLVVLRTSFTRLNANHSKHVDEWGSNNRNAVSDAHKEIAEAILEGNSNRAKKLMEKHITDIKYSVLMRP